MRWKVRDPGVHSEDEWFDVPGEHEYAEDAVRKYLGASDPQECDNAFDVIACDEGGNESTHRVTVQPAAWLVDGRGAW